MLKAALFDMDGVLVDSHACHIRAWNKLLRLFGRRLSEADIELLHEGLKREELIRCFLGDLNRSDLRWCSEQKQFFFEQEMKDLTPIAGAERFLGEMGRTGVPIAVVSSASRPRVHQTLEVVRLRSHFRAIVTGDDIVLGKCSPAIFYEGARRLGVESDEILVFEDSQSAIRVATASGMKCIGVASGHRAQDLIRAGAIRVVPDFVNLSYEQINIFFAPKMGGHENSSRSAAFR